MSLLALLNPSQAFLSVSTVLAGYCLFRYYAYTAGNLLVVPYLLGAGALLGMADSAWRRLFARAEVDEMVGDAATGVMSTTAAYFIAAFLTIAGLMCAMTGGYNSFRAAGGAVILILARASLFRRTEVLSPLLGGLVSGMLFVVGMTAHPSFIEMLYIMETRLPVAFFTVYMVIVSVLPQVRDSSHPRAAPEEELSNETASRLLDMRDDAVDRAVVAFAGAALFLLPLILAWIMPWRWLSWTLLGFLSLGTAAKLVPVLVYRTRKDLENFIGSAFRGGALLNAGCVASLGTYRMTELYDGWFLPLPGQDQMVAIFIIAALAAPAWLLRRIAPVD